MTHAHALHTRQIRLLETLLAVGARATDMLLSDISSMGWALLGPPLEGEILGGGHSELNGSGAPLQLCLTSSRGRRGVRLIADPAWHMASPGGRLRASLDILNRLMEPAGAAGMAPFRDALLACALPDPEQQLRDFTRGTFWIGAGVNEPGVALYMDTHPHGEEGAWDLAGRWLASQLPAGSGVADVIGGLRSHARLASIGFEGVGPEKGRLKIYWRLRQAVPLATLGIPMLRNADIAQFLIRAVGGRNMPFSGTVFSLGFDIATGRMEDAKIDLCGHCLPRAPRRWVELLADLCAAFDLPSFNVAGDILSARCDVAFLGFGIDRQDRRRLNLYLEPPKLDVPEQELSKPGLPKPKLSRPRPSKSRRSKSKPSKPGTTGTISPAAALPFGGENLCERIAHAVYYLTGLQRADGSWDDYQLPVGKATEWVTGFVGLALADVADATGCAEARDAAERAARRLVSHRSYESGWGYNDITGADADSSGLAIRLLRSLGHPVREDDEAFLLRRWRTEGGFSTYEGPENWGEVHPCVTAMAFLALDAPGRERLLPGLTGYLARFRRDDGTWPAYWWNRHFYSTYHHLILLRRLGLSHRFADPEGPLAIPESCSAQDLAYAVGIEHLRNHAPERATRLLRQLLEQQKFDGGWAGGYNLRVTDPACAAPWEQPRGTLYIDGRATITTASVLMVLAGMLREHHDHQTPPNH